jgi:hypothetical protein
MTHLIQPSEWLRVCATDSSMHGVGAGCGVHLEAAGLRLASGSNFPGFGRVAPGNAGYITATPLRAAAVGTRTYQE